ncbi:hypothetical protein HPB48_019194 [Haemaphysalis longicornis]|uniref:Major facilitator superfamily (MFS) profile domain-containing protein n=1 Tax=Haemaphysalis longicornis TaxID=44386 RepID=A0A9J6FTN8_HAELO|nr:hypothetical protein HPB48_019194 [Haemaphysalis longicornis]
MQRVLFKVDVQKERFRLPLPRYFMSTLANAWMAAVCAGATLGYTSPAAQSIAAASGDKAEALHPLSTSPWFTSLLPLGAMLGALLGGPSSQYLGRRQTLLLSALCFMAGYSCIMTARSAEFTLIGRFVTGLATGIVSLCAPVYISEIVVATQRGSLGAVFQLAVTLGILYSYVMSRFMQWKWLAAACFFCSVLLVITSHFAVESPRWLLLRGRKLDAILCLQILRGPDIRVDDECYAIEQVFPSASTPRSHVLLALKGNFMQQFSGINMFIFYAGSLFQSVGISISAKDTSIIMAGLQVGATLVAVALMDVVGRRRLLSVSSIICVFALTTIGALYSMSSGGEQEATPSVWPSIDRLPVVFMGLYVMGTKSRARFVCALYSRTCRNFICKPASSLSPTIISLPPSTPALR